MYILVAANWYQIGDRFVKCDNGSVTCGKRFHRRRIINVDAFVVLTDSDEARKTSSTAPIKSNRHETGARCDVASSNSCQDWEGKWNLRSSMWKRLIKMNSMNRASHRIILTSSRAFNWLIWSSIDTICARKHNLRSLRTINFNLSLIFMFLWLHFGSMRSDGLSWIFQRHARHQPRWSNWIFHKNSALNMRCQLRTSECAFFCIRIAFLSIFRCHYI